MPRNRVKIEHAQGDGSKGELRIRDRQMIYHTGIVPTFASSTPPPPPECCCADWWVYSTGGLTENILSEVSNDLRTIFDKYYGAANRVTVGNYDTWTGASCSPAPPVKVVTTAYLDSIGDSSSLCSDPPAIFEAFNFLRDAIVYLCDNLRIVRRPVNFEQMPDCDQFSACQIAYIRFQPLFSPTKPCEDTQPCANFGTKSKTTRVAPCQKLCLEHYLELKEIVDDILANGVVRFGLQDVETDIIAPCSPSTPGFVCYVTDRTVYGVGEATGCQKCPAGTGPCCFSSSTNLATFSAYQGYGAAFDSDLCPGPPIKDNFPPIADDLLRAEWTQNGTAVRNGCSFTIPCLFNVWDETGQIRFNEPVICTVSRNNVNDNRWFVSCQGGSGFGLPGLVSEFWSAYGVSCTPDPVVDCSGTIASSCEICQRNQDGRAAVWEGFTFSLTNPDVCDSDCQNGFSCPGPVESTSQSTQIVTPNAAEPKTIKRRNSNGSGDDEEKSVSFKFRLRAGCPDSGLTNTVMLDSRLPQITMSYQNVTIPAPSLADPDCPGNASIQCQPPCFEGYGEFA